MSSGPDLYLVCKSCGAEVSPYITECPYCGTRIQKRAPKLDRGGVPKAPRRARSRPQLPRLRPGEIPGIRADTRPWAVWVLVVASLLVTVGLKSNLLHYDDLALATGLEDPWRAVTTLFAYQSTGYEAVTVGTIALFGFLLERRHGWWAPLLVFLLAGAGGAYVAVVVAGEGLALGANGAALGLLAAWAMRDILGRRKGFEDESDLLGVLAIAAVLVLMPLATTDASGVAGVVGGVIGIILGLGFARLRER
ncbi:rhomboid family intramembrane serine protease [Solirubrobacter ginsenosidimutans]|uniref:Rhomboid family intramembrane serine protease n=1 Tax=Solirubrobacter ginsenosidimutans TaxID=490573 RepID=A0A9X3MVB1_9ACTN|nr:rhomboid family intramembrane serine protease [Solirubrobacter ginsenosidimutans]MDA0163384.1 rhomboid family intramembrane serine protease [Solirubrobacter ginsenosidimutans]